MTRRHDEMGRQYCPNCDYDSPFFIPRVDYIHEPIQLYQVCCPWCQTSGPEENSPEKAIEAWNRIRFEPEDEKQSKNERLDELPQVNPDDFSEEHAAGWDAYTDGYDIDVCPFEEGTHEREVWIMGWGDAQVLHASGWNAYTNGKSVDACRYKEGTPERKMWVTGWEDAKARLKSPSR